MANTEGMADEAMERLLAPSALQRRMDMPMGDRPAARVVRSSGNRRPSSTPQSCDEETPSAAAVPSHTTAAVQDPAVIGAVVERTKRSKKKQTAEKRPSRFLQERQGFPTLDVPIGTFLALSNKAVPPKKSQTVGSSDAGTMLADMSVEEIRESVAELESALSPQTIAFLKRRGKQKAAQGRRDPEPVERPIRIVPSVSKSEAMRDKERMAEIMSSIRTYEDLDAAYAAEMAKAGNVDDTMNEKNDFNLACELLRSSVPRQRLWAAKTVAEKLQEDLASGRTCSLRSDTIPRQWPYPILLPVSLRCVLDSIPLGSSGPVFLTYILQSIYSLLQLRACPDHVVDVTCRTTRAGQIYQMYFMEDAVPMANPASCYSAMPMKALSLDDEAKDAPAYATSSSSVSAQSDGEAFQKDPMWTLLSKMRVLPSLAKLLHSLQTQPKELPDEAMVAAIGILSMIGQRSPGAASAIVQHKTLLADIIDTTLAPTVKGACCNTAMALPTLILLGVLARQSRVAAEGIDIHEALLRILATEPVNEQVFLVQRHALILWRTLLRYGLGLSIISSLMAVAAPHLALGLHRYSLASDFFSAFTCALRCVRVGMKANADVITAEQRAVLSQAGVSLSSLVRRALKHVGSDAADGSNDTERLVLWASCIRFLEVFISLHDGPRGDEFKTGELSLSETDCCVESLCETLQMDQTQAFITKVVSPSLDVDSCGDNMALEAAASACLDAVTSITIALWLQSRTGHAASINGQVDKLASILAQKIEASMDSSPSACRKNATMRAREAWLSRANSTVAHFLAVTMTLDPMTTKAAIFMALGRLDCGEESRAAVLLSHDILFQPDSTNDRASALSTMLVRELCSAPSQLDHSFKLYGGFGITATGDGPFGLSSLLSEADDQVFRNGLQERLIPMGSSWLWQCLSGSVVVDDEKKSRATEAISVLLTTLRLISEVEDTDNPFMTRFVSSVPVGSKLYSLSCVCLHPESILGQDEIQRHMEALVDKYVISDAEWAQHLIAACHRHSSTKPTTAELPEDLLTAMPVDTTTSAEALRSLEQYVGDLCEAYVEYGAQYDCFTKCIRLFLRPIFPPKVRCQVLAKLRGILHLMSLDGDDLPALLSQYIAGGLPAIDSSSKDPPSLLDALADCAVNGFGFRSAPGLLYLLVVGSLARSLAICLRSDDQGVSTCERRIDAVDEAVGRAVVQTTAAFLSSSGTKSDLITATLQTSAMANDDTRPPRAFPTVDGAMDWNAVLFHLKACIH